MSILRDIRVLHLEPTDVCQAACPACARETDVNFDRHQQHHLSVDQVEQILPREVLVNLDKMFMCGNYGDPAAGRHTLKIYQYFRSINPDIVLGMNTNGAIQNSSWWQQLGELFNQPRDYVVFSIDGLEDTNHLYRRGVDWEKLIKNVQSFIKTGASAHWDMLVYQHNEHQVDACEELAKKLGFRWFRVKVSRRPLPIGFYHPISWDRPQMEKGTIVCQALKDRSAYIDAKGRMLPCCWFGTKSQTQVIDFQEIQKSWESKTPELVCQQTCSQKKHKNTFEQQWQKEVEFNV